MQVSVLISSTVLDTFLTPPRVWLFARELIARLIAESGKKAF